jgi:choline-sulfatase
LRGIGNKFRLSQGGDSPGAAGDVSGANQTAFSSQHAPQRREHASLLKARIFKWGPRISWLFTGWASLFVVLLTELPIPLAAQSRALPPVILISVDTLRADRLSCYGFRGLQTPNIDAMSHGGTLFSKVSSQVPLTMPSHASMLTSTHPFSNGVEDNGQPLPPSSVTLASVLKSKGYRTAAFVGGFVLDKRFGLNQGFDLYDSPFNLRRQGRTDPGEVRRSGGEVVRAAQDWLRENSGSPFFLFLHLYDLHLPYEVSPSRALRPAHSGYDRALAYEDEVLGDFWSFLKQRRLLEKTLIVFTSDHGESLWEHGESTHGYFIYQSTLWVPLIIHWPEGSKSSVPRVDEPASLLDIAPTVLQFVGIPQPASFQGRGLLDLIKQKPSTGSREIYSESLYGRHHFGSSSLRSLRLSRYKYIEAPKPEFYDLASDPAEKHNLYVQQKSLALTYRERLLALRSRFATAKPAAPQVVNSETAAALSSLGYAATGAPKTGSLDSGPDPKERIADFESSRRALDLSSADRLTEANVLLEKLCSKYPDVSDLRISLGVNQRRLGKHREAVESFRRVLNLDSLNVRAHFDLAVSHFELQELDEALKELRAVLLLAPYYSRAAEMMGTILLQKKDYVQARAHFEQMLRTGSDRYVAHYHLGTLAMQDRKWQEAESHLKAAVALDPQSAEAHNGLGVQYLLSGELELARQTFMEAVRLEPKFAETHYNLGLVLRQQKRNDEAARAFRAALAADPKFRPAREALSSPEFRTR